MAKHFGIFNINKVLRLSDNHLLSILNIEALAWIHDALTLEGVVSVIGLNI